MFLDVKEVFTRACPTADVVTFVNDDLNLG